MKPKVQARHGTIHFCTLVKVIKWKNDLWVCVLNKIHKREMRDWGWEWFPFYPPLPPTQLPPSSLTFHSSLPDSFLPFSPLATHFQTSLPIYTHHLPIFATSPALFQIYPTSTGLKKGPDPKCHVHSLYRCYLTLCSSSTDVSLKIPVSAVDCILIKPGF